jgi:hypothetical protein
VGKSKVEGGLTQSEQEMMSFFQMKGAIYLLVAAVADSLETILGRRLPNRFSLEFKKNISANAGITFWKPILEVLLPLTGQILDGFSNNRISGDRSSAAISRFRALVGAVAASNKDIFKKFAAEVHQ